MQLGGFEADVGGDEDESYCLNPVSALCLVSAGFFLLFTGYFPAQTYLTIWFGSGGGNALVLIYVSFPLAAIVAPVLLDGSDGRLGLVLASVGYSIFMSCASQAGTHIALLYFGAVVVGSSGGVLWPAAGTFLGRISRDDNRGTYAGFFTFLSRLSGIVGNVLGNVMAMGGVLAMRFYLLCGAVSLASLPFVLGLLMGSLQPKRPARDEEHTKRGCCRLLGLSFRMLCHPKIRFLVLGELVNLGLCKGWSVTRVSQKGAEEVSC